MAISTWTCPHCDQLVQVDVDRSLAQKVVCGACNGWMEIPAERSFDAAPPRIGNELGILKSGQRCTSFGRTPDQPGDWLNGPLVCPQCEKNNANNLHDTTSRKPAQISPTAPPVINFQQASPTIDVEDLERSSKQAPSRATQPPDSPNIVIQTPDGNVELSEPKAVVQVGSSVRPLRRLTRKEKVHRQMVRNVILWLLGSIILILCALWRM